ncbi:MAG: riboflavin synthase [Myxococcota bacterium]
MFTGLIEDIGQLTRIQQQGEGARLLISTRLPLHEVRLGDSIAVCGACLTVTRKEQRLFEAEISRETLARTAFVELKPGAPLHLERAMRLSDRLDGHLVLGHVDGTGILKTREERGDSLYLEVSAPPNVLKYVVEKGSIAVHGVSLTVNALLSDAFSLTLVPYTRNATFLDRLQPGDRVNLEADLIGKYVERLLGGQSARAAGGGLTLEHLARHGYL